MRTAARPPIEQLCRDLHCAILRVLQPSSDVPPMPWQEFQRRAGLDTWDRHSHWKLKEGQLRWGPDKLITVARSLGIGVRILVDGPDTDSNAPSPAKAGSGPAGAIQRANPLPVRDRHTHDLRGLAHSAH